MAIFIATTLDEQRLMKMMSFEIVCGDGNHQFSTAWRLGISNPTFGSAKYNSSQNYLVPFQTNMDCPPKQLCTPPRYVRKVEVGSRYQNFVHSPNQ